MLGQRRLLTQEGRLRHGPIKNDWQIQNCMRINHSRISMYDRSYIDKICHPKKIENEGGGTGYGFVFKMMP